MASSVEFKIHEENLCSIAGIENNFSGRFFVRDILNGFLRKTGWVVADIQRPYYKTEDIFSVSSEFENLKLDKNWFSATFNYRVKEDNDKFLQTFLDIWFEYEQPAFSFFKSGQIPEFYETLTVPKRVFWKDVTELAPCYIFFKSIEEDVIWIGKSENLSFDGIVS